MPDTSVRARSGTVALAVAHCAGMIDLVSLPVWVGTLVSKYGLDAQEAGGLATIFLTGAVVASLLLAPRFSRLRVRLVATVGFGAASLAFAGVSLTQSYGLMAVLHGLAGLGAGAALSVTHGSMGRSQNPHRLFAISGLSLGLMGIVFLGVTPPLVEREGGALLFRLFAGIMLVGAVVSMAAFPGIAAGPIESRRGLGRVPRAAWFGIAGVIAMALVQAMVFSFVERIGADRGFGLSATTSVLIATGLVSLFPAPLAAVLEGRISAWRVMVGGPIAQALGALVITMSTTFVPYAISSAVYVSVMIFTHTFAFGLLSRLDTSGRAVAATPAMLMTGAAIGPILGGSLILASGYPLLGVVAIVIDALAVSCFWRMGLTPAPAPVPTTAP